MITEASEWRTLTYNFSMPALSEVELVCEFRASSGRVRFDADSLKLVRKAPTGSEGATTTSTNRL
jgi:hypothetical protein